MQKILSPERFTSRSPELSRTCTRGTFCLGVDQSGEARPAVAADGRVHTAPVYGFLITLDSGWASPIPGAEACPRLKLRRSLPGPTSPAGRDGEGAGRTLQPYGRANGRFSTYGAHVLVAMRSRYSVVSCASVASSWRG